MNQSDRFLKLFHRVYMRVKEEEGHALTTFMWVAILIFPLVFLVMFNYVQANVVKEVSNKAADEAAIAVANNLYNRVWEHTRDKFVRFEEWDYIRCWDWCCSKSGCKPCRKRYEVRSCWLEYQSSNPFGRPYTIGPFLRFETQKNKIDQTMELNYRQNGDVDIACSYHPDKCFKTGADEGWSLGKNEMGSIAQQIAQENAARLRTSPYLKILNSNLPHNNSKRVVLTTEKQYQGLPFGNLADFGGNRDVEQFGASYPVIIADTLDH